MLFAPLFADILVPTPEQVSAITQMGFVGAVLTGVGLLARGVVIFRREADARDAISAKRLADMRRERDNWRLIAERATKIQEKHAEVAEGQARDIHRLADSAERTAIILGVDRSQPGPS